MASTASSSSPTDSRTSGSPIPHQYPTSTLGSGSPRLELGDLYAREPKSVLVEFFVPALPDAAGNAGKVTVAHISLTAHVLTDGGGVERQEIVFPIVSHLTAAGHSEPEVRREMLLLDAAKAREDALRLREDGDMGGAVVALRRMSLALAAPTLAFDAEVAEELEEQARDLADMASQFAALEVREEDAKYLAQRAYNAHRGKRAYEAKLTRVRSPRPPKT